MDRENLDAAAEALARLMSSNTGSASDDTFRAFVCDAADLSTGIQLVVRGTQLDHFHTWLARLREDAALRERYDALKRAREGGLAFRVSAGGGGVHRRCVMRSATSEPWVLRVTPFFDRWATRRRTTDPAGSAERGTAPTP